MGTRHLYWILSVPSFAVQYILGGTGRGEGGEALEEACDDIKNNLDARGCCMRERRVSREEIKYADMKYCHVQYRQRQEDVLHRRHSRERDRQAAGGERVGGEL